MANLISNYCTSMIVSNLASVWLMAKAQIIDCLLCILQVDQMVNLEHAKVSATEVTQIMVEITFLFLQC